MKTLLLSLLLLSSTSYAVDISKLLDAIRCAESANGANLESHAGALGPYQIMPSTGIGLATVLGLPYTDNMLYAENYSRELAKAYIQSLLVRFDDNISIAVMAYNYGPTRILDKLRTFSPLPIETVHYHSRVMAVYYGLACPWEKQ